MLSVKQFIRFFKDTVLVFYSMPLKDLPGIFSKGIKRACNNTLNNLFSANKKIQNLQQTNLDLGIYHFYKGNLGDAHFRFKLLQMFTSRIKDVVYYNLGRCYIVQKKYKKAHKNLLQASYYKKNYPELDYYLAKIINLGTT